MTDNKMLTKMIETVVNDYMTAFLEEVSTKYTIPYDELVEMWGDIQKSKPKKAQQSLVLKKPKRQNSYQVFQKVHRPLLVDKGMSFSEISKELSRIWKSLDEEEKAKYKAIANNENTQQVDLPMIEDGESQMESSQVVAAVEEKKPKAKKSKKPLPLVDEESEGGETRTEVEAEAQDLSAKKPKAKKSVPPKKTSEEDAEEVTTDPEEFQEQLIPYSTGEEEEEDTTNKKTKRPKVSSTCKAPDDLSPREKELWNLFEKMKKEELKKACEESGIKTGNKKDMILGLVRVRIALQDGFTSVNEELDDDDAF